MFVAAILLATGPAEGRKQPLVGTDYGPPPDWERYRALGEAAIKADLVDPDSAHISWPNGYVQRGYTPFLSHRIYGYSTCGEVNSRNRMGGYAGASPFVVVIDNDVVKYVEIGRRGDMMDQACANANLPRAPEAVRAGSGFGFTFAIVPDGVYVATLTPGGPADTSGMKTGMVITHFNGIALKGLGAETVGQIVSATQGVGHFALVGGAMLSIARTPTPASAGVPAPDAK